MALNLNYSGCCVPSLSQTCWNYGCYCDQICHTVGDCCSDVADIGCHPPTIGKTKAPVIQNSYYLFTVKSIVIINYFELIHTYKHMK